MRYYIKAFKNYCKSEGRASRKELWFFFLFHYLVVFILSFLDGVFGFYSTTIPLDYGYMTIAYLLISICPAACVQIRRLHDINKSGKWWWLFNAPLISLYILYLYLKRGDSGVNNYGPPPNQRSYETCESTAQVHKFLPEQKSAQYQSVVPETTPIHSQIKFCRKCGFELIAGSKFCSKCGTAIIEE